MKVLAIDLGLRTGWAVLEDEKLISSGYIDIKSKKDDTMGRRFNIFEQSINNLMFAYEPDVIAYEAVKRWMSSQAALIYGGIHGETHRLAWLNLFPIVGYAPTEVKKFCTGKGRAEKSEIIAWANEKFNLQLTDDNEADAIAIGYTHIHGQAGIPGIKN